MRIFLDPSMAVLLSEMDLEAACDHRCGKPSPSHTSLLKRMVGSMVVGGTATMAHWARIVAPSSVVMRTVGVREGVGWSWWIAETSALSLMSMRLPKWCRR